ncbi:hypothetical protein MPSEU_000194900 [Mayamaea pseudoterrestris]|nr:hypothetical protein MPSEU_000194900 [Mayamaea pseudoterrestris]
MTMILLLFLLLQTMTLARALAVLPNATNMISSNLRSALPGLLDDTKLTPLDFPYAEVEQTKHVSESKDAIVSLRQAAKDLAGPAGSLCFVVRRPGCTLCRQHALQLKESAGSLKDFALWAIVKETGVDDEGLIEFHDKYFDYPTFKDEERAVYTAFGSRKIGLTTWNPFRLYQGYKDLKKKLKEKNIDGNFKGEGFIQGGLLLFDRDGNLQYSYDEQVGTDFEMDIIIAAAKLVASGEAATAGSETKAEL